MKKLRWVMAVFALVLTASIVYAAASSTSITGTTNLSGINVGFTTGAATATGSATGSWDAVDAKSFTAMLTANNETATFSFALENLSSFDVEIVSIVITESVYVTTIVVDSEGADLEGAEIGSGNTITGKIIVTAEDVDGASNPISLTITINYKAIQPI